VTVAAILGLVAGASLESAYGGELATYRVLPAAAFGALLFGWILSRRPRIAFWDSLFWAS
jgi:hypothetical protein